MTGRAVVPFVDLDDMPVDPGLVDLILSAHRWTVTGERLSITEDTGRRVRAYALAAWSEHLHVLAVLALARRSRS